MLFIWHNFVTISINLKTQKNEKANFNIMYLS